VKKVLTAFILCTVITLNGYALIEVGLEGGYLFGNLTFKALHEVITYTKAGSTWVEDTTYIPTGEEAETQHPKGLGISLLCGITLPALPVEMEIGGGFSSTGFKIRTTTWTINSISFSLIGKYLFRMPVVSPYIKIGPFFAFNTHKMKTGEVTASIVESERTFNFGISCGLGAKIGLIPKFPLNIGLLYNHYIGPKAKFIYKDPSMKANLEYKFSQQDIGIFFGITHKIL
jgi:opacity protein-like surface antigen